MATPKQIRRRGRFSLMFGAIVAALLLVAVAYADNVKNDIQSSAGGVVEVTAGDTNGATVGFLIQSTNGDSTDTTGKNAQTCNAADETSAIVTINVPSGVTANPSQLTFTQCDVSQNVKFTASSSTSGDKSITVSVSDSGAAAGDYNASPAAFTLRVNAAGGGGGGGSTDSTPPNVDCNVPSQSVWHGSNQTVNCTASDSGSGLKNAADASFSLSTSVAAGDETSNAQTGSKTVEDNVGNQTTVGPYAFKVDMKAPAVACDTPAPAFLLNQSPATVSATATDGGSGPAWQNVSAAANTLSVGSKTVSVSATDSVGNQGSKNCSYTVAFDFIGFSAPVNNPNWVNKLKAGQAVPFKWRLLDANGAPVTNLTGASMAVSSISCSIPTEGFDPVEELAAGSSGLQNLGDGYYQVNWKSLTSYAGSCRVVNLNLGEGIPRPAWFQFTK